MTPKELAQVAAGILDSKKAENILILNVAHLTSITDYFVICGARNTIKVRSLAEELADGLALQGVEPRRQEGASEGRWIVLDYSSVIVHIFHEQEREYYNIERLWMDGSNAMKLELTEGENS